MTKSLKIALILSAVFIGIIRLRPIWERNPGGFWTVLFFFTMAVLFFLIAIKILIEFIRIIKKRKSLNYSAFLPIIVLIFGLIDGLYNPLKINLENVYGDVLFQACYEGTQNQATFKLKEGNRFELHWTGVFFYNEFFTGTYQKNGDTIFLKYDSKRSNGLGDKLLKDDKNKLLKTIRQERDSLKIVLPFYYGNCKGLN